MPFTYAYTRISRDRDTEKSESPERQLIRIQEYQEKNKEILPEYGGVFVDRDVSGNKPFSKRPESGKLMMVIKKGDHLVVASMDRLGRNTRDVLNAVYDLEKTGVTLHILDFFMGSYKSDCPGNRLLLQIIASVSEFERSAVVSRTKRAKQHAASLGRKMAWHDPPIGFKWVRDGNRKTSRGQPGFIIGVDREKLHVAKYIIQQHEAGVPDGVIAWGLRRMGYPLPKLKSNAPPLWSRIMVTSQRTRILKAMKLPQFASLSFAPEAPEIPESTDSTPSISLYQPDQ